MLISIPGTTLALPSPWDLLQAGLTSRDWIARHHGPEGLAAWEAAGCPDWVGSDDTPADQGVIRTGWARTRYAKRYRV